jgi:hypothetical protein
MGNDQRRESIEPKWRWASFVLCGVGLAALIFDQAHPQQLGKLGSDGILLVVGSLIVVVALLDVRSGTCTLCLSTFKRSEDSTGFWTSVLIGSVAGALMIFGALGDLLGLWRF